MMRMEICCCAMPMREDAPQNRSTPAGELQLIQSMNTLITAAMIMVCLRCGLSLFPICMRTMGKNVAPAKITIRIK